MKYLAEIKKKTWLMTACLFILTTIVMMMGLTPVKAEENKTAVAVKVVYTIENKVVPLQGINENYDEFLKAAYTTKLVAADGTEVSQAIIDKSQAKLVQMYPDKNIQNPLVFSGLESAAYSFDEAIPRLLNQYVIKYDEALAGKYKLTYWYEEERSPLAGTDFESNKPSFAYNDNAAVPSVDQQEALISDTETFIQDCLVYRLPAAVSGRDAVFGTNGNAYGSWLIFTAARAEYTPHAGFYAEAYDAFVEKYTDSGKNDSQGNPVNEGFDANEVAKDALAITAMGYDARNVGGYDLIEMLTNGKNPSNGYFVKQVSEFAIDSYNYLPNRDHAYIHELAANALAGSVTHSDPLIDMYVMEFQPIAAFYDPDAKAGDEFYDVKQAMETVLMPYFSRVQGYTGLFYSGIDYDNPWSNAQSFIMLGTGDVNFFQTAFIKNGYSMLNILPDKNKSFSADEGQIARGYEALVRSYRGETKLFDCTDVINSTVKVNNAILALPEAASVNEANKAAAQEGLANVDAVLAGLNLTQSQKNSIDMSRYNAVKAKVEGTVIDPGINCRYHTHIQDIGWEEVWKTDGNISGTFGQSLRLEGIEVKLDGNSGYDLGIQYKTHIENIGWEDTWKTNGLMSGTTGKSLRLEAIQIELTGADADKFDVYYQVHAQNFGWLNWAKNGESAGTAGFAYRLEGIKIVVVPKGEAPPAVEFGTNDQTFVKNN
ncbi:Ig domain-containing protein [Acetobacterium bakii]|uniref:Ig domain-containing protein n=1 Tax=Acetobacterium bakii TaxID=52689 RepID=UPI00068133E0|nr:Ig domain-containing protein [Acetobacterium bakii]